MLSHTDDVVRLWYNGSAKQHTWCAENFVPADVSYKLNFSGLVFIIKWHSLTMGFAGEAEVVWSKWVEICSFMCLDNSVQKRKQCCFKEGLECQSFFSS